MPTSSPMQAFFCAECDSHAVEVSGPLDPDAEVVCGECGAPICSWADFMAGLSKAHGQPARPAKLEVPAR
jgi:hypothetical protein